METSRRLPTLTFLAACLAVLGVVGGLFAAPALACCPRPAAHCCAAADDCGCCLESAPESVHTVPSVSLGRHALEVATLAVPDAGVPPVLPRTGRPLAWAQPPPESPPPAPSSPRGPPSGSGR